MATTEPTRCQATNQSGKPCSAAHWRDGWCRWHHPDLTEQRKAWSAKGGANRSNKSRARKGLPAELMTMEEVQSYLGVTLRGVLGGKVDPGVGTAVANIARAMTTVAGAGALEQQIADLAQQIAELTGRRSA